MDAVEPTVTVVERLLDDQRTDRIRQWKTADHQKGLWKLAAAERQLDYSDESKWPKPLRR